MAYIIIIMMQSKTQTFKSIAINYMYAHVTFYAEHVQCKHNKGSTLLVKDTMDTVSL